MADYFALSPLTCCTLSLVLHQHRGHRGASAAYPENTIASFDRAVRDGSEGIESG